MKRHISATMILFLLVMTGFSQDIRRSGVPSVILNNFQRSFPKATDVEWERKGDIYKVEFEIGLWNNDHSAWYNGEGELIRHKKEISSRDLPEPVQTVLKRDYRLYWVKDVEQITEGKKIFYKLELKSVTKDWDMVFSESGQILSKKRD